MLQKEIKKEKLNSIDTKKFTAYLELNNIETEIKEQDISSA